MFDGSVILLVGPALARTLLVMPERTVPPMDTMDALGLMADAIRRQQRAEQVQLFLHAWSGQAKVCIHMAATLMLLNLLLCRASM